MQKINNDSAEFKKLWGEARDLRISGKDLEALLIFKKMVDRWPTSPQILLQLGGTYQIMKEYDLAAGYLKQAVKLIPRNEFASQCLTFVLWRSGKIDVAFDEVWRYVLITREFSDDYDLMIRDLRGDITGEEYDQIEEENRQKKLSNMKNNSADINSDSSNLSN